MTDQASTPGDPWLDTLLASLDSPQHTPLGERLPAFPSEQLQANTTGLSREAALRQAFAFYQDVKDGAARAGLALGRNSKLLDFGFGWGRISRVFMREVPRAGIHGIDVDPEFVELTRGLFDSTQFHLCPAFPPSEFEAGSFDLVFAYSVFSHLSEDAAQAWMREFHRILRPGGVVAFTTRHDSFFDYCAWAATADTDNAYTRALGRLFPDLEDARARYRAGQIVHASSSGVDGGGPRNSTFYGETWIPEAYARTAFGPGFEFVAGYFDGTRYDQATFVLKKKA